MKEVTLRPLSKSKRKNRFGRIWKGFKPKKKRATCT